MTTVEDIEVEQAIVEAMHEPDLARASEMARAYALSRWGSRWLAGADGTVPDRPPRDLLSLGKLSHDMDQFRYLRERDVLGAEFDEVIAAYADIAAQLGPEERRPLEGADAERIGDVYNRIVHLHDSPRMDRALSDAWDPSATEEQYLNMPPGIVVIDDFLSAPALQDVRRFCLESTIWSANRYTGGRLGAFFVDGFSSPLLAQIAQEVRAAFPRLLGDRHTLRQYWGFKNAPTQVGVPSIHADFAAVNVNFWITPTEANLDDESGGLIVWDAVAPPSWDFQAYNERTDLIDTFLAQQSAKTIRIPYRENRAIIFNSDLFHATADVRFRSEYEYRRVNITMLFGDREDDQHHPAQQPQIASAWRSPAMRRRR